MMLSCLRLLHFRLAICHFVALACLHVNLFGIESELLKDSFPVLLIAASLHIIHLYEMSKLTVSYILLLVYDFMLNEKKCFGENSFCFENHGAKQNCQKN